MNEELELLYKALSTSIDLGSYEQFASGMQNPKNRAKLVNYIKSKNLGLDVSEYTLEKWSQGKASQVGTKVEPSRNQAAKSDLDRFNEGFDVAQAEQLPVEPTPPNQAPVSMGVPKTGPLSLAEPQPTGKEKVLTGLEGVPISELYNQYKTTRSQLEGLDPQAESYNTLVTQFNNIGAEINNRGVNEPYKQFVLTSPQYREERRKILAQKQPAEARLQAIEQQLFSQEKEFNPLGEVTARANGFESYEEMRLATNAGLTEADLRQKPNPPSKDQTDAIVTFLGEHYQNIPQSDKVELERYLIELAGSNPDQFWRTVRLSTPDSPLVGVGKAALLGGMAGLSNVIDKVNPEVKASTKARLLEDTYVNKLGKLKTELSNLEARISSDPNLGAEYAVFADALNVVSQLEEKKGRTPQEEQQLQDALTAISNLQTPEVKQYAATLAQYKTDYKNLSNVLTNFPEELARRALLDFKNKQQVIQPTDNVATKVAKQMQAIKGSAANTALRIGGTTLKTIAAMPDRLARAITGQEYTSTAERYFEETGKFIESAIFLPELPENMRSSIAQDLMGQTKIRGEAVLPGIATGLVQMGALVFGGQALGSAKLLNSSAAGLTASGFVFEFNDMYESFLNEGLSSRAALGLAAGISYVVARMELISPQGVGLSFLDQSVKGAVKELSKATTKDFVPAFAQGSLYMMKQLGLENLQEFSQDGAKTIGNFLINKAYGTNLEDSFETEQIAETALITTGTTFIFTLLTGKSQRRGEAYEAAKYLAEKPEQLEAELQRRVSSNRMTAEQARQVYNYVQDVKKTEDANKAKEAFDKKIEGYVQGKPVVEDYEGPTEISAEDFFAADYSVPSGVIVDLDGTKYEVTNDDKGVTLTIVELEEKTEQTPEGETVTSQQVKPTKQKLTVEEFNELYQAPQGDRVADEVKVGNVATYQGKEYRITDVTQDGVTLENYAGSARMTVPASQVQAFTVQPLSTYTYKGQQYSINQQQKTAIENIDQVEQEQLEKYQDDTARVKRIKKDFEQSRRQALGLAPTQVAVGDEMFLNGRPVKVLGKRGSKVTVDMEGAQMSVEQADLSLSDNTELQQSQEALKEKVKGPQKGHVFKIKGGQMSKEDTKAYMKVNRVVADQINRAKKYTQVLPDMEVEVYESVEQARQAAIDAGAPESVVRGMNVGGRDISYFEEVNDTESEVTYLDGTKELVPTADIRENTFGGFWDGKNRIIINASHATNTTVAHEILHPVIESILKNKPEVVQRFFDQLKNETDYQAIRSFVEQYDAATQPIEALVEFVARVATPEFNFKKRKASFKRKVVDFFKRLFGMVDTVNINTDNVLDFAQGLADYLQKGRAINIEQERSEGRFQLLAPNGKPSNLTPEQYVQVRTPEFKAWFGDWEDDPENASKVVDSNGEPMVVFHGTNSRTDFYIFEPKEGSSSGAAIFGKGMYFSDSEEIARKWGFKAQTGVDKYKGEPARIISAFLDIKTPNYPKNTFPKNSQELGYDGVIASVNLGENKEFVVFSPTQIKSATENVGSFSPTNPDIRFQLLAPNGKPSNLTPQQYRQVRTPEFKAWFGPWDTDPENASKVVDENGEPLVKRHNSDKAGIEVFKTKGISGAKGIFLTDKDDVKWGKIPYFVFALSKNPFNPNNPEHRGILLTQLQSLDANNKLEEATAAERGTYTELLNKKSFTPLVINGYPISPTKFIERLDKSKENWDLLETKFAQKALKAAGFDGVYLTEAGNTNLQVFSPTQIKSAVSNVGTFDAINPDIRFQRTLPEDLAIIDGFYSPIEKRILETKQEKQSATKWLGIVGGKDEAIYTGVKAYLESLSPQQQVTKQDLLDWMRDNRIEVVEVVKGGDVSEAEIDTFLEDEMGQGMTREEAREYLSNDETNEQTKYHNYQLDGEKENYKEVLVTMPGFKWAKNKSGLWAYFNNEGVQISDGMPENTETYKELAKNTLKISQAKPNFKSSHWDEPNIIAHIRTNVRTDSSGNKVQFIEEFQSDWGQAGKRRGFTKLPKEVELARLREERDNSLVDFQTISEELERQYREKRRGSETRGDLRERDSQFDKLAQQYTPAEDRMLAAEQAYREFLNDESDAVPEGPFVTNTASWVKLAWKYALKEAVKSGSQFVAWTTGEQQNERYDLSKQVDYIQYGDGFENTRYVDISHKNGLTTLYVDKTTGKVTEEKNQTIDSVGKNLEDVVGKDLAEKILADKHAGRIEGEGLKVGGQGMRAFYDQIVPQVGKAVIKELTGVNSELSFVELNVGANLDFTKTNEGYEIVAIDEGYRKTGVLFKTEEEANAYIDSKERSRQPAFEVTPQLAEEVQRGMPRFQRTGFHGTPHRFPKEILVQKPDGTQEYLVGTPDEFPVVPANYEVIREFPFGRFRMDKMGTGEGAQAYGWGMYFTELEDIARWYADKLRQWGAEEKAINDIARQELDSFSGDKAKAIASLEQTLKEPWADKKRVKAAIRVIKTGKELAIPKTNLLQVTLHKGKDPSEYTWLDWDQPVGRVLADKINAHIKDKRLPTLSDTSGAGLRRSLGMPPSDIMIYPSITTGLDGGYAYRELVEYFKEKNRTDKPAKYVPAEQQASLFLLEAGIDGIRFPAESKPRDKARGFNYVVFDENAIEIEQVTRFQRTNTLQQAIANGTVTFTDAKGNPCARGGFKQKKVTRGGTWQIIKEFKGKTHEQGGIDVEIKDGQISMTRGETKLEAKYGLLI